MSTICTSFSTGFKLRMPDGEVRSFPACQWHNDPAWEVRGGELFRLGSRDEGFKVLGREAIPAGTQATYWDDGEDSWFEIA